VLEYGNLRLDSGTRGQTSKGGGANNLFIWEWGRDTEKDGDQRGR